MADHHDDLLSRAIAYAADKHKGQVRKGSDVPYIVHPLEAAAIVASMTTDRELIAAAVLHDTLEDCDDVTFSDLEKLFGTKVAGWVGEESEEKQQDAPGSWKERKQATIDRLISPSCSREHKILTLGDKLSNLRAIYRDQLAYGDSLWERFNQKDKAMHQWYYKSIGRTVKSLNSFPAWQEYERLLGEVFNDDTFGEG